jgi:hypothetical protein
VCVRARTRLRVHRKKTLRDKEKAVICASSENGPFHSFAHLLIGLFALLVFNFLSSLYTLDINPLSDE